MTYLTGAPQSPNTGHMDFLLFIAGITKPGEAEVQNENLTSPVKQMVPGGRGGGGGVGGDAPLCHRRELGKQR